MRKDHPAAAVVAAIALIGLAAAIPVSVAEDNPAPARTGEPDVSPPANPPDVPPRWPILESHELQGILGKKVRSATGENMGRIVDFVVDRTGQVRAAVIDLGGFLGCR
jgi:hypothetical protein